METLVRRIGRLAFNRKVENSIIDNELSSLDLLDQMHSLAEPRSFDSIISSYRLDQPKKRLGSREINQHLLPSALTRW